MPKRPSNSPFPPVERYRAILTLFFVILVTWWITSFEKINREIQVILYQVVAPVLDKKNDFRNYSESLSEEVRHSSELELELAELSLEVERLRILEKNYRQLESHRNELRELLAIKTISRQELLTAEVVGRNPGSWLKSLFSVRLLGSTDYGIVSGTRHQFGEFGGNVRLKYLPKTVRLTQGMVVETSGKGTIFPEGLTVGVVESFSYGVEGVEAVIRTQVDLRNLRYVFVVKQ